MIMPTQLNTEGIISSGTERSVRSMSDPDKKIDEKKGDDIL
jgi:hypothetical protein